MPDHLERCCRSLARRQAQQRLIDALGAALLPACLVGACVVILLRLALPHWAWLDGSILAGCLLLPLLTVPACLRRGESDGRLAARIDRVCGARGLAMAMADLPADRRPATWMQRLGQQLDGWLPPRRDWRPLQPTVVALACLAIAWFLPQRDLPTPVFPDPVANLFAHLEDRLETLAEEELLDPETLAQEEAFLRELAEDAASDGMAQEHWQALDQSMDRLDRAVERAAQQLAAATQRSDQLALSGDQAGLAELARQLSALSEQAPGLMPTDSSEAAALLAAAQEQGLLSREQVAALRQAGYCQNPGQGQRPGPQGDQMNSSAMQAAAQQLRDQLAERRAALANANGASAFDAELAALMKMGRGGVNRGPGHAPLQLSHDGDDDGSGELDGLLPGAVLNADGSVTINQQRREAEIDDATAQALQRAALRQHASSGTATTRATVTTRHRATVGRYFAADDDAPLPPLNPQLDIP